MIYERLNCRFCGGSLFMTMELAPTPLANDFPLKPDADAERFPLQVMQCPECKHVQLKQVADANVLFSDYKYSTPRAFLPHLESLALKLKERYPNADKVLEIGSNNNLFVDVLRKHFRAVVGVDPASPDDRFQRLFTSEFARELGWEWQFHLIVANNVFAHIDDLHDVFAGIEMVLAPEGSLVFEVQYLPAMMESGTFDMIYHEHHDYHTLRPLMKLFQLHQMHMTGFEFIPTHGGSIRVTVNRWGVGKAISPPELPLEHLDWEGFARRIEDAKQRTVEALRGFKTVAAFGATAKACTLIHQFGIADRIGYCFDETPQKQKRYIPGTNIRITNSMGSPDALLLTAWNYESVARARFPNLHIINPFAEVLKEAA